VVVGNIALFAVRPANHWPLLESAETLQVASLIPIALILYRRSRRGPASRLVLAVGLGAMALGIAIDIGFVSGLVTYGAGAIGGALFYAVEVVTLAWLLAANVVAWRDGGLSGRLAGLGVATALMATLLYPAWAVLVARATKGA